MRKLTLIFCLAALVAASVQAEVSEVRFPLGAGGVGFLPLLVMQKYGLIEKYAKDAGIANLKVRWINIGGPAVMREQLDQLLSLIREEKTTVQVIPYTVGAYGASDSNFTYLEFGGTKLPDLVYVETLVSHLYIERPDEVGRYSEALDSLRDAALNPRDSARKIEEIRDDF